MREFINPIYSYFGERNQANIAFNIELQRFSYQVTLISILHTKGKISSENAHQAIEEIYQTLEFSKERFDASNYQK